MWNDDYKKEMGKQNPSEESLKKLSQVLLAPKKKKWYTKNTFRIAAAASLVLIISVLALYQPITNWYIDNKSVASAVKNYDELYDTISTIYAKNNKPESIWDRLFGYSNDGAATTDDMAMIPESNGDSELSPMESPNNSAKSDFSDTNLQVLGVQEADIIKTDGSYIYALSNNYVYIISADNGNLTLSARIDYPANEPYLYQNEIFELYITGNRLIVLKNKYENTTPHYNNTFDIATDMIYRAATGIMADIYDITDKSAPRLIDSFGQSGNYVSSRMIGNILYFVSNQYIYESIDKSKPETFIPQIFGKEETSFIAADDIYINNDIEPSSSINYLVITGIDTGGNGKIVSEKSLLGYGSTIYASKDNLYVAAYSNMEQDGYSGSSTKLIRFSLNGGMIEKEAEGMVPGNILNQFSMDEYNDTFRIVTTAYPNFNIPIAEDTGLPNVIGSSSNCLYVLNPELTIIGKIENLAQGEQVYSVRFSGDIGYFVTFRQVDPLFTVDLSDPANPSVLSALKIPGFSEYLHPYSDGLLFGLGKDADIQTGMVGYMKLSMFDTSDPVQTFEKHKLILDGIYYSEASYNHKAILIDSKKSIIAFPSVNEYLIYSYSGNGFAKEATIRFPDNEYHYMIRGLYIQNYLYVFSGNSIYSYDLNNYQLYDNLPLLNN